MSPLDLLAWVGAVCACAAIVAVTVAIVVGSIRGVVKPQASAKARLSVVSPGGRVVLPTGPTPPGGVSR